MIRKIKKFIKQQIRYFGYSINRNPENNLESKYLIIENEFSFLYGILSLLLLQKKTKPFSIVQVGANDGVTVDPVYPFALKYKDETELLLIEPQTELIAKLKENYKFHPNYKIANLAVGKEEEIILYKINQYYQKYYKGITGSGITSQNKNYVKQKALKLLPKTVIKQAAKEGIPLIYPFTIKCTNLHNLILNINFAQKIDWLQVDTEGFDDEVIFNSNIEILQPSIISYEISLLSKEKINFLNEYLENLGYYCINISRSDACAIRIS